MLEEEKNASLWNACVIWGIVQFDILFLIKLHKNKELIVSHILTSASYLVIPLNIILVIPLNIILVSWCSVGLHEGRSGFLNVSPWPLSSLGFKQNWSPTHVCSVYEQIDVWGNNWLDSICRMSDHIYTLFSVWNLNDLSFKGRQCQHLQLWQRH